MIHSEYPGLLSATASSRSNQTSSAMFFLFFFSSSNRQASASCKDKTTSETTKRRNSSFVDDVGNSAIALEVPNTPINETLPSPRRRQTEGVVENTVSALDKKDIVPVGLNPEMATTIFFTEFGLKWLSLILLVAQSSAHALMIRYSKTVGASQYLPSTTVVVCELLKFVLSLFMVLREYRHEPNPWAMARLLITESGQSIVPAGLYAIQNNLVFIALANLDAATFQVMYQSKIVTTALFSVIILQKRLSITQWISLLLLFQGVILVQTPTCDQQLEAANKGIVDLNRNTFLGFLIVVMISLTSGFAGVYFEKILKSKKTMSVFARNLQLSLWGFIFSVIGMLFNDWTPLMEGGLFQGYNFTVWTIINISAFGGLLIAIVVKYTDNIAKGFATSISIILSSIISAVFFDFSITTIFVVGASIVILSVILYSDPDKTASATNAVAPTPPLSSLKGSFGNIPAFSPASNDLVLPRSAKFLPPDQ